MHCAAAGMWGNFFPKMGEYLPNVTLVCIRMYSLCIQKNSEYTQIHNSRIQKCILSIMYSGVFSKTMNTLEYILIEYNVFYEHFNTQWNTCIPLLHNPVRRRMLMYAPALQLWISGMTESLYLHVKAIQWSSTAEVARCSRRKAAAHMSWVSTIS